MRTPEQIAEAIMLNDYHAVPEPIWPIVRLLMADAARQAQREPATQEPPPAEPKRHLAVLHRIKLRDGGSWPDRDVICLDCDADKGEEPVGLLCTAEDGDVLTVLVGVALDHWGEARH